jgi:hypothetical protein
LSFVSEEQWASMFPSHTDGRASHDEVGRGTTRI